MFELLGGFGYSLACTLVAIDVDVFVFNVAAAARKGMGEELSMRHCEDGLVPGMKEGWWRRVGIRKHGDLLACTASVPVRRKT